MASVSNPGLRGASFTSLPVCRERVGEKLARALPRPAVSAALAVDEGVEPRALLESGADPRSDRLHERADVGVGRQLAGQLQSDIDLPENVAKRAHLRPNVWTDLRRVTVGCGARTTRGQMAIA